MLKLADNRKVNVSQGKDLQEFLVPMTVAFQHFYELVQRVKLSAMVK